MRIHCESASEVLSSPPGNHRSSPWPGPPPLNLHGWYQQPQHHSVGLHLCVSMTPVQVGTPAHKLPCERRVILYFITQLIFSLNFIIPASDGNSISVQLESSFIPFSGGYQGVLSIITPQVSPDLSTSPAGPGSSILAGDHGDALFPMVGSFWSPTSPLQASHGDHFSCFGACRASLACHAPRGHSSLCSPGTSLGLHQEARHKASLLATLQTHLAWQPCQAQVLSL